MLTNVVNESATGCFMNSTQTLSIFAETPIQALLVFSMHSSAGRRLA